MRPILTSILLLLSLSSLSRDMTPEEKFCSDLSINYMATLTEAKGACGGLKSCQSNRRACDQNIEEQASCEDYNQCMRDQFPSDAPKTVLCNYEWKFSFATRKRSCTLTRPQNWPFYNKDCPGYVGWEEDERPYSDPKFNCEGQKLRYLNYREAQVKAYYEYKAAIDSGKCSVAGLGISLPEKCEAAFESL